MKFYVVAGLCALGLLAEMYGIRHCQESKPETNESQKKVEEPKKTTSVTTKINKDSIASEYSFNIPKLSVSNLSKTETPLVTPQVYELPGYKYSGISNLYAVPKVIQSDNEKLKVVEVTEPKNDKKLKLSYHQNFSGNETGFELEANNPTREERAELYKLFVQQAREAQAAVKDNFKVIKHEGNSIIVTNFNSR